MVRRARTVTYKAEAARGDYFALKAVRLVPNYTSGYAAWLDVVEQQSGEVLGNVRKQANGVWWAVSANSARKPAAYPSRVSATNAVRYVYPY